jgi:hypothetical protein
MQSLQKIQCNFLPLATGKTLLNNLSLARTSRSQKDYYSRGDAETRRRGDVFYYKLFYSATLRLRVQKNIPPENDRISRLNY